MVDQAITARHSAVIHSVAEGHAAAMSARMDIVYRPLRFDTLLPTPNWPSDASSRLLLPPCPNVDKCSDPTTWSGVKKYTVLSMLCVATMLTTYAAGAPSPAVPIMVAEFETSRTVVLVGTTLFCLGFALAPMFLAPFSELKGRYPIFVAAGIVFVLAQVWCALSPDLTNMLLARFMVGAGCSVFSTMIGGVVADMWSKEERNLPMAIYSGAVLIGTGLGPLVSSLLVHTYQDVAPTTGLAANWRWVFWIQVILDGLCVLAISLFLQESRPAALLSRKARKLNTWYKALEEKGIVGLWVALDHQNMARNVPTLAGALEMTQRSSNSTRSDTNVRLERLRWLIDEEHKAPITTMIGRSIYRPFHLLFTEPVVIAFALWASFSWAVLFLCFSAIPLVFQRTYSFNVEQTGLVFVAIIAGSLVATFIGVFQEKVLQHPQWVQQRVSALTSASASASEYSFWVFMRRHFPMEVPESRLYLTCLTSILLPLGLYLFGLAANAQLPWIVPALGIAFSTCGVYHIYLATFNYVVDSYRNYASSALAAQGFCRYILAGIFPLVVQPLFTNLSYSNAGILLGTIATALTAVPWLLSIFGTKIRQHSKLCSVD